MTPTEIPTESQFAEWLASRQRRQLAMPHLRKAAVLVALTRSTADFPARFLLTERSRHLPTHKGQIAFAGGRLEAGESTTVAALREAHEEVGLLPSQVSVLGQLDDVFTPVGFQVTPVLALIPPRYDYVLSDEVTSLLMPTWQELRQMLPIHERQETSLGWVDSYRYLWNGYDIWGMTARIIHELLSAADELR